MTRTSCLSIFRNFTPSITGSRPKLVSIDGGVVQTQNQSFDLNGESNLDLQYAMSLVSPQNISLLQTGDLVEGASFDNWLDAVDASFCTFEGGDDPSQDGIYPDPDGGYTGMFTYFSILSRPLTAVDRQGVMRYHQASKCCLNLIWTRRSECHRQVRSASVH